MEETDTLHEIPPRIKEFDTETQKNGTGIINQYVNTAYSVHWDLNIHTRDTLSLVTGSIARALLVQKINTNISTK